MENGDRRLKGKRITERWWKVVPESRSSMRERAISNFERRINRRLEKSNERR